MTEADTGGKKALLIRVTGRVQMVMYRDFASHAARRLGLSGFVQNMPDGSVSAYAEGSPESLDVFLGMLRKGSRLSRVDSVVCFPTEPRGVFSHFTIRY